MELENDMQAIREARDELDEVIREIQAVPELETFLAPPTFADVAAAATQHPIVYVSPAELGGLALVLDGADVRPVPLDALTAEAVHNRVSDYTASFARYRADSNANVAQWDCALDAMLRWLWDEVMAPIIDVLDANRETVLIAGGLLGLLPLHAAWTSDETRPSGRRYASDEVVISYAPNARALSAARAVAARIDTDHSLIIVEPQPVSAPALEWASVEGAVVAACSRHAIVLDGGKATHAAFTREAPSAALLHLACHGMADLDAPLESGLLLAGNRWMTLNELLGMRLEIRLAVLSACETSLPGTDLPDEVVALPTGLLQAGAAGVIASQWAVPDFDTALLMADFYRRWQGGSPARALATAQHWMRDTTNDEKLNTFERSLDEAQPWVSRESIAPLLEALLLSDPDAYDHAMPRTWAAFAHFGV
jgi:CHAT domain-containing protein